MLAQQLQRISAVSPRGEAPIPGTQE